MSQEPTKRDPLAAEVEHHSDFGNTTSNRLDTLFEEFKLTLEHACQDASSVLHQLEELKQSVQAEINETERAFEGFSRFGTWSKHRLADGAFIPLSSYVPEGGDYQTISLYRKASPDRN